IRFFQLGFSYQAQVPPPKATMSGLLSPLTSATSTWYPPGISGSMTIRSNRGRGRGSAAPASVSPASRTSARVSKIHTFVPGVAGLAVAVGIIGRPLAWGLSGGRCRQYMQEYWWAMPTLRIVLAPACGGAGGVFGLDAELVEVALVVDLGLGVLEAVFELRDAKLERGDPRFRLIRPARSGDFRIAELALKCGEEVERVAAAVGAGDLALLLAEE